MRVALVQTRRKLGSSSWGSVDSLLLSSSSWKDCSTEKSTGIHRSGEQGEGVPGNQCTSWHGGGECVHENVCALNECESCVRIMYMNQSRGLKK